MSKKEISHAFKRGFDAWEKHNKFLTDNPYKSGPLHNAWVEGYIKASKIPPSNIEHRAPEGRQVRPHTIVVVKRTSRTKFNIKGTDPKPSTETMNYWLGYVKKKKHIVWTRNPPEPKQKEK